jgi:hypothetical protein
LNVVDAVRLRACTSCTPDAPAKPSGCTWVATPGVSTQNDETEPPEASTLVAHATVSASARTNGRRALVRVPRR